MSARCGQLGTRQVLEHQGHCGGQAHYIPVADRCVHGKLLLESSRCHNFLWHTIRESKKAMARFPI